MWGGLEKAVVLLAITPSLRLAAQEVKLVSVCELLANLPKYNGKPVVVVGRVDCSWSLTDHYCFVAADRCDRPLLTDGHTWPNKLLIAEHWEAGTPSPPDGDPRVAESDVLRKLSRVARITKLGQHGEPRVAPEAGGAGLVRMVPVKDQWGAVYGRVLVAPEVTKRKCGSAGCRGYTDTPAALVLAAEKYQRTYSDVDLRAPK